MDVEALRQKCDRLGQGHILQFWDELNQEQRKQLTEDMTQVDLQEAVEYFQGIQTCLTGGSEKIDDVMEPLEMSEWGSVTRSSENDIDTYRNLGLTAVANNEVAVLLLAGGQGTRLGVPYPKGMYDVGLPSGRTLYQLQAERIIKLERLAQEAAGRKCCVPWYIMTSEHTQEATEVFFQKHNFFGLDPNNVIIFEQTLLPCFDLQGKILLDSKFRLALAPGGNGGLYQALREEGALADMIRRQIKYIHVYCVDNILVKMADPVFVGFCLSKNVECGAKVVEKSEPKEAVGVVCKVQGRYQVVEYSEVTLDTAARRTSDGRLLFSAGNICNHFFTTEFLKRVCLKENESQLKHHVALKKVPFVDSSGQLQKPCVPNGIKMEKFVFDVFQFAQNLAVWEVIREHEFSPLKNAEGASQDTPSACRKALLNLHYHYLLAAGATFVLPEDQKYCSGDQSLTKGDSVVCEISPLVSYAGEGLEKLKEQKLVPPVLLELDSSDPHNFIITHPTLVMR